MLFFVIVELEDDLGEVKTLFVFVTDFCCHTGSIRGHLQETQIAQKGRKKADFLLAITNRVKRRKQHLYKSSSRMIQLLSGFHVVSCKKTALLFRSRLTFVLK